MFAALVERFGAEGLGDAWGFLVSSASCSMLSNDCISKLRQLPGSA